MNPLPRLIALAAKMDLGRKPNEDCCGIGPASPTPKVWYPSLWIEEQAEPIDLPDTGKAVIEYKINRKTTRETNGKKRHEASLDVHSISAMPEETKKKLPGAAKPLKIAGFAGLTPGMISFADSRPRTNEGEFAPQAEGGPDPTAMARAYGPGAIQKSGLAAVGIGGAAVAALLMRRKFRKA